MSVEHVKAYLTKFGAENRVMEFEVSSATVELAAAAIGCEGARIAKTLSYMVGEQPVLIVTAGDSRIDNRRFKDHFAVKAKMMTAEELDQHTGLQFGGVCPFGIPEHVAIYLDESLRRFETVYPSCGTSNSAIEVTLAELEAFSRAKGWIHVTKDLTD